MLQEHHRIVIPDGCLQKALGVRRRGGADHLQPGNMGKQGLQTLGMLTGVAASRAHGCPEYHRNFYLAAGHVPKLRRLVHHRVQTDGDEIIVHPLHYRPQAPHGGAYRHAGEAGFADGRVNHPVGAELLQKAPGDGKHIAHDAHILAQDDDVFIPDHFLMKGLADGLTDGGFHLATLLSLSVTNMYRVTSAGSGSGEFLAN